MRVLASLLLAALPGAAAIKTGPEVGSRIPAFEAADLDGEHQSFETLRGQLGLVLLFVRSADW